MSECSYEKVNLEDDAQYWKDKYEFLLKQYIEQERELYVCLQQNKLYKDHSVG